LRIAAGISETQIAKRRQTVFRILEAITIIEPTRPVLARASQPLPTTLGTLDAIHLATALLWKERSRMEFVLATHDAALALAARASGLAVLGA
jgi:predicted nucleic acid-binding protein